MSTAATHLCNSGGPYLTSNKLEHYTMEAFTTFASSLGLTLKELTIPAVATPDEVLRRFYIVLDLAESDKGLLFYSFDNRVCGMCSSALPNIPGLSCSDMNGDQDGHGTQP